MKFNFIIKPNYVLITVLSLYLCNKVEAWTTEELDLFDLVEEINQNFYDLLGLDQSATTGEVKKAYRRLSLLFHPDKNKEEGAEEKFRKIVSVSEVLKDEARRKQYDELLINGLPDWRMPIYYYRRARKMGLWELFFFLFLLLSTGQYIVAWSMYWEKKYEIEEVLTSRFKSKKKKKGGKVVEDNCDDIIADTVNQIPKPSVMNLFPVTFTKLIICSSIYLAQNWRELLKKKEPEVEESSDEEILEDRVRKPRKRVKQDLPEFTDLPSNSLPYMENHLEPITEENETVFLTQEWNERDSLALAKAMNKFPGGTIDRWEKISVMIRRPVAEVTSRAKSLKSSSLVTNVPTGLQGVTGNDDFLGNDMNGTLSNSDENKNRKPKKVKGAIDRNLMIAQHQPTLVITPIKLDNEIIWSQNQQRSLENAMHKFPKGTDQRWDKISEEIPGKTKDECIVRYKMLVDAVRKKKSSS